MDPGQPTTTQPQRRSWWDRNWKWFVPTGCFTILLLFVAFVGSILFIVTGAMKASDAYQAAFDRAQADPRVIAALGSPIQAGYFISGSTDVSGSSGKADLTIPISGPNGKGTIYLVASKFGGEWTFSRLVVDAAKTGQRIDLTKETESAAP